MARLLLGGILHAAVCMAWHRAVEVPGIVALLDVARGTVGMVAWHRPSTEALVTQFVGRALCRPANQVSKALAALCRTDGLRFTVLPMPAVGTRCGCCSGPGPARRRPAR